jgi:hypothetical protein
MTTPYEPPPPSVQPSGWAVGGLAFAASMLILVGAFQIIDGIVAIANDDFFVRAKHYTFHLDITAWGWIHLILGILLLLVGIGLFRQAAWAGVGAIAVAMLAALNNFFFIPYYPIWSLVIIGLCVWIIWSLTRPGVVRA